MLSKHTPGPWQVGEPVASCGHVVYIPIIERKNRLAATSVYKKRADGSTAGRKYIDKYGTERNVPTIAPDECEANARLIAAAPELLEALERMVLYGEIIAQEDSERGLRARADVRDARKALNKAKGEAC